MGDKMNTTTHANMSGFNPYGLRTASHLLSTGARQLCAPQGLRTFPQSQSCANQGRPCMPSPPQNTIRAMWHAL